MALTSMKRNFVRQRKILVDEIMNPTSRSWMNVEVRNGNKLKRPPREIIQELRNQIANL